MSSVPSPPRWSGPAARTLSGHASSSLSIARREAWRHRVHALAGSRAYDAKRHQGALLGAFLACLEEGNAHAAADLARAVRASADESGIPSVRLEALAQSARLAGESVPFDPSWTAAAQRLLEQLPQSSLRERLSLEIEAARAHSLLSRPDEAAAAATRALEIARSIKADARLPEMLGLRSRARRGQGLREEAHRDLEAALTALQRARDGAPSGGGLLAERAWWAAQDLAHIQLEAADAVGALRTLEETRNGTAITADWRHGPPVAPGANVLAIETFTDETALWLVDESGLRQKTVPLGRRAVRVLVEQLMLDLDGGDRAGADLLLGSLAHTLLTPLLEGRARPAHVYIVASGHLARVPWPAVMRRAFPEGPTVSQVPSLLFASGPARRVRRTRPVLLVGAPGARAELTAARNEVDGIAALYTEADVLFGDAARPEAVLKRLPQAAMVHVAAHARALPDPRSSYLDLSTPRHPDRRLSQEALLASDLGGVELVVLSSCRGAAGAVRRASGPDGLAEALLRRGVGAVVASVAEIDDRAAAAFATRFHAFLSHGDRIETAFAQAVREIASDPATAASADSWVLWGRVAAFAEPNR